MPVVSNTSPILNLAIIDRLKILRQQFGQLQIPYEAKDLYNGNHATVQEQSEIASAMFYAICQIKLRVHLGVLLVLKGGSSMTSPTSCALAPLLSCLSAVVLKLMPPNTRQIMYFALGEKPILSISEQSVSALPISVRR